MHRARAPRSAQQRAARHAPAVAVHEALAARRVVHPAWKINERRRGRHIGARPAIAEKKPARTRRREAHLRGRRPLALLARSRQRAVRREAHAVRIPKARRDHRHAAPIAGDPHQPLIRGHRVEIPRAVALQAGDVVVPAGRGRIGVGKALVKVRLAVAIQVMEPRDLIAPEDVDDAIDHAQSERLAESRGKAPPDNPVPAPRATTGK